MGDDTPRKEYDVIVGEMPRMLIIHCDDPRFASAIHEFIHESVDEGGLGLAYGQYVEISLPGGVSGMSEQLTLPKHFKVQKEQIEFVLERFTSVKTVVLINHEDCRAYQALRERIGDSFLRRWGGIPDRQKADLVGVGRFVQNLIPVECVYYYAKFANDEHTSTMFERVV